MLNSHNTQILLLLLASAAYALAFLLSYRDLRTPTDPSAPRPAFRPATSRLILLGLLLTLILLLWRTTDLGQSSQTLYNHFDTFLVLSLLLAALMFYFRFTRHLRTLAYFLLPMISLLLLLGATLTITQPSLDYRSTWTILHVLTILAGSASFAAAAVAGFVYLLADSQLRTKRPTSSGGTQHSILRTRHLVLPPLASLEKANQLLILFGFPLLTVGMLIGLLQILLQPHALAELHSLWPKILLTLLAWLVYAPLLHLRLAPSFRGRRAAYLSILGFLLLLAVWATINFMPRLPDANPSTTARIISHFAFRISHSPPPFSASSLQPSAFSHETL